MSGRKAAVVEVDEVLRQELVHLIHKSSAQQRLVFRARIILAAMEGQNNAGIAQELGVHISCVVKWRRRWVTTQILPLDQMPLEQRLTDAPRPGKPARISPEALCQIMALACHSPEQYGRAITHWTERELAQEAIKQGLVTTISPRHVGRFLKSGRSETAFEPLLAYVGRRGRSQRT